MPELWKIGETIPIIAKCFERAILPKLSICAQPIMDELQFAYLPNGSTDDAIATLIHELTEHLDRGSNYARCLSIGYSSAFNTMQPHILINGLAQYKVPARSQLFILDFLTNRKQYVRTNTEISSTITINTGAPLLKDVCFPHFCLFCI